MYDFKSIMMGAGIVAENNTLSEIAIDIVFVIDSTEDMMDSMSDIKHTVSNIAIKVEDACRSKYRRRCALREKIISFRDYYFDGEYAMKESKFFTCRKKMKNLLNRLIVSKLWAVGIGRKVV